MAKKKVQPQARQHPNAPCNQPFMGAPQRWDGHTKDRMRVGKTRLDRGR